MCYTNAHLLKHYFSVNNRPKYRFILYVTETRGRLHYKSSRIMPVRKKEILHMKYKILQRGSLTF